MRKQWMYRFLLLLVTTVGPMLCIGCRTYGGHGSGPKTYEALQSAVQSFESDLDRGKADLRRLKRAASEADTLQRFVERYRSHIDEHRSLLETQRQRINRLSPEASYRSLHRAYGATLTEQRMMQNKYQHTIRNVQGVFRKNTEAGEETRKNERRYTIEPIGFPDLDAKQNLTLEEVLRGR